MTVLATVTDPDGRLVALTAEGWAHVVAGHADLRDRQNLVLDAVGKPDHRGADPINDRERYWRQGVGPSQWLRVVVDFSTDPAQIVTAFAERRDPPGWKP